MGFSGTVLSAGSNIKVGRYSHKQGRVDRLMNMEEPGGFKDTSK